MPKSFIISVPIGDAFVLPTPDCTRHRNAHAHKACIKRFVRKKKDCTYPNTNETPKLVTLKSNGKGENDFSNINSRFVKINSVCVFARSRHLQGKSWCRTKCDAINGVQNVNKQASFLAFSYFMGSPTCQRFWLAITRAKVLIGYKNRINSNTTT